MRMTDEEVYQRLMEESTREVAAFQKGERPTSLEGAPVTASDSISELVWYVGAMHVQREVIDAGATQEQLADALIRLKATLGIEEPKTFLALPSSLATELANSLRDALADEPEGQPQRLDEKLISEIPELRVEMYMNESQHRGRPHVAVSLPDGKISVSLDDPPQVLTPHRLRGEASALQVIAKYRLRLLEIWSDTRPDDQRLPN